jgi:hypothetical protein
MPARMLFFIPYREQPFCRSRPGQIPIGSLGVGRTRSGIGRIPVRLLAKNLYFGETPVGRSPFVEMDNIEIDGLSLTYPSFY